MSGSVVSIRFDVDIGELAVKAYFMGLLFKSREVCNVFYAKSCPARSIAP